MHKTDNAMCALMTVWDCFIRNIKKMVQIEIDDGSGFCFGVTTAIRKAEEELAAGKHYTAWATLCTTEWSVNACAAWDL